MKKNHEQSKKHKFFLKNLIVSKYITKNEKINNLKDIVQSYYNEHKKKISQFKIIVIWKKNNVIINKISGPCTITHIQTHMFKPIMEEMPFYVKVSLKVFQNMIDRGCEYIFKTDEIKIIFISKLEDITISHYVEQPKSMLCRKLERNHIEEDDPDLGGFGYIFLPECFRHINMS